MKLRMHCGWLEQVVVKVGEITSKLATQLLTIVGVSLCNPFEKRHNIN